MHRLYNGRMQRRHLQQAYTAKVSEREALEPAPWKLEQRNDFLDQLQKEGRSELLELGSGVGPDAAFFQASGLGVTAIDLTPANAAATRAKGPAAAAADLLHLPFPSNHFAAAYSLNCFIHLPHKEWPLALAEARRVLQPGAPFHLSVFGGRDEEYIFEDDDHTPPRLFAYFRNERLKNLLTEHFSIESFHTFIPDEVNLERQIARLRKSKLS